MNRFLKFIFRIKGYQLDKATQELHTIQCLSQEDLLAFQQCKAWEMFQFHCANNPHYKEWVGKQTINQWEDVPILTKADLQVPLEHRFSVGFSKKNTFLNSTSGSTGTPQFFAKDKYAHAMTWANIIDKFSKHHVVFGSSLQARFYGIPIKGVKYYKEKIKDALQARVRFPVFNLSNEALQDFENKFKKKPFYYANGYTSSLVLFAKYFINKGITAKSICPTLMLVATTSEVCDEIDRAIIEKGFGVKVVNEYGASELDLIALEDENGNWLLNHETLMIEVLNDENQAVKPGEEGRIIITSLFNKAMPFIRYELGDSVVLEEHRVDKYQVLKKVLGRTNDNVQLPSGKQAAGFTFYYISKALMSKDNFIKEYMVKQTKIDEFIFEYVADEPMTLEQKQQIQNALNEYLEPDLKALFLKKEAIERTKAGKLKRFISLIKNETPSSE